MEQQFYAVEITKDGKAELLTGSTRTTRSSASVVLENLRYNSKRAAPMHWSRRVTASRVVPVTITWEAE